MKCRTCLKSGHKTGDEVCLLDSEDVVEQERTEASTSGEPTQDKEEEKEEAWKTVPTSTKKSTDKKDNKISNKNDQ